MYSGFVLPRHLTGESVASDDGSLQVLPTQSEVKLVAKWPVVQGGRTVHSPDFVVRSLESGKFTLDATMYSSSSRPLSFSVDGEVDVTNVEMSWRDILAEVLDESEWSSDDVTSKGSSDGYSTRRQRNRDASSDSST